MKPTISIIGGDLRQVHLARLLQADGWDAVTWGLEQGGGPSAVPLDQALEREVLLLPMPIERDGLLHLPLTDTELETDRLWPRLRYDQLLLGGLVGALRQRLMLEYGLTLVDYYAREETQVANAVPTASPAGRSSSRSCRTVKFETTLQGLTGCGGPVTNDVAKRRMLKVSPAFSKAAVSRGRASGRPPQRAKFPQAAPQKFSRAGNVLDRIRQGFADIPYGAA